MTIYNVAIIVKITNRHPDAIKDIRQNKKTETDQGRKCKTHLTASIGHSNNHEIPLKNQPKYSTNHFIDVSIHKDKGII